MKYLTTILTVLLLTGTVLIAQDAAPKRVLLLKECVNIAIQNNTTIKASEEDKLKALADYHVATAQRLFMIDAYFKTDGYPKSGLPYRHIDAYSWLPYLPPYPSIFQPLLKYGLDQSQPKPTPFVNALTRDFDLGLTLGATASVSLYDEKKARNQSLAKINLNMFKLQNKKAIEDVIYNVKNAYCTYLMARESVVLKEKMLKGNKDKLRMTEILYKNAQRSVLDLSRAQYDYQNSQLELQRAMNAERAARADLFRNMGIDEPGTEFALQDFKELPEVCYSIEQLQKLAEDNFPDLQLVKMQTQLYRMRMEVEKASNYPSVDLQLQAGVRNRRLDFTSFSNNFTSDAWKQFYGVMFQTRLNLFSSGLIQGRIDSTKAEYNKAMYKEKDVTLTTRTLMNSQYQSLNELKKMIDMSQLLKENAEKNMLMARKSYESGAGTQLEINEAIMSYQNAELGYQKAKYDYLMAVAKISNIVGLGEDALCKK